MAAEGYAESAAELQSTLGKIKFLSRNDEERAAGMKEFVEGRAPTIMDFLEKAVTSSGGPFLQGKKVSFADLQLFASGECCQLFEQVKEVWDKYPKLAEHSKAVAALPKIAAYIAKRPVTEF